MNKRDLMIVLQSCLLAFDEAPVEEHFRDWANPRLVKIGKNLCEQLKSMELK